MAISRELTAAERYLEPQYRRYLLPISVGVLLLAFLAAPWPLAHKAHAALHGLCAQVPSHTLRIGDQPLPFDSRMTGIYGGFLVTAAYLCARGRYRASRLPSISSITILILLVAMMAVDGTNSFLLDMQLWHPYTPDNRLRLATGLITGVSLAVTIAFLVASTVWKRPDRSRAVVDRPSEIALIVGLQAPFALVCLVGGHWFFAPVVLILLLAAVSALTALVLVATVLFKRTDGTFDGPGDLQSTAVLALLVAVAVMVVFSGGRFLFEHFFGPPVLT